MTKPLGPENPGQLTGISEDWAEEGGLRLLVERHPNGSIRFSVVDVTPGWPGEVVASASLATFRVKRLVSLLAAQLESDQARLAEQ